MKWLDWLPVFSTRHRSPQDATDGHVCRWYSSDKSWQHWARLDNDTFFFFFFTGSLNTFETLPTLALNRSLTYPQFFRMVYVRLENYRKCASRPLQFRCWKSSGGGWCFKSVSTIKRAILMVHTGHLNDLNLWPHTSWMWSAVFRYEGEPDY